LSETAKLQRREYRLKLKLLTECSGDQWKELLADIEADILRRLDKWKAAGEERPRVK
jgi:hypothetical protein